MTNKTDSRPLRVAVVQMTSTDDPQKNVADIVALIGGIPDLNNIDLICLPENALYFRLSSSEEVPAIELGDSLFQPLQQLVDHHQLDLLIGSVPIAAVDGRAANATVWLRPGKPAISPYQKIHLFDVDVAGAPAVRESANFVPGTHPAVIEVAGWSLGLSICYDVRFSELYSRYARAGVDAILVPAAFLQPTGKAHWHTLLRARAIESQCYVIAAAQAGTHVSARGGDGQGQRKTFGHSLVVDPWGEVILDMADIAPQVRVVELDPERLAWVKRQIPQQHHRRLE